MPSWSAGNGDCGLKFMLMASAELPEVSFQPMYSAIPASTDPGTVVQDDHVVNVPEIAPIEAA